MLLRKHNEKACENREDCFLFVKDLLLFWKVILLITALECNSQTMQERECHAMPPEILLPTRRHYYRLLPRDPFVASRCCRKQLVPVEESAARLRMFKK
jgi:hypothetical protein